MTRFILKILLAICIFIATVFFVTYLNNKPVTNYTYTNYNVEANLFNIKKGEEYNYVFMGISHARNFSRHKNHLRTEKALNAKILNLGIGGGRCGTIGQHSYLKYFYQKKNKADEIIYVLSMPMLFTNRLNEHDGVFEPEPFRPLFFWDCLSSASNHKNTQLYYYLRSKYHKNWKKLKPYAANGHYNILARYDTNVIAHGFDLALPNGLEPDAFEFNKKQIIKTVQLAEKNGTEVSFIITPALFGEWPGHDKAIAFLNELKAEFNIAYYDYSTAFSKTDIQYFYDHHHLNTSGIEFFLDSILSHDCRIPDSVSLYSSKQFEQVADDTWLVTSLIDYDFDYTFDLSYQEFLTQNDGKKVLYVDDSKNTYLSSRYKIKDLGLNQVNQLSARVAVMPEQEQTSKKSLLLVVTLTHNSKPYGYFVHNLYDCDSEVNTWNELSINKLLPKIKSPNDELGIFLWNQSGQRYYIDNFTLSIRSKSN